MTEVRCGTVTLSGKRERTRRRRRRKADQESGADAEEDPAEQLEAMAIGEEEAAAAAGPCARARAGLAARGSQLFLYGGQLERGSVEVTLSDFYQLGECPSERTSNYVSIGAFIGAEYCIRYTNSWYAFQYPSTLINNRINFF